VTPDAQRGVQRMLDAAAHLEATYRSDSAELARLRQQRQQVMKEAEFAARSGSERQLSVAEGIQASASLGSQLRAELTGLDARIRPSRSAPAQVAGLSGAIAEWQRLAGAARRGTEDFRRAFTQWSGRMIKSAKSMPQVDSSLWAALDRLDQIHQAVPALREAFIVARINEATSQHDATVAQEALRRTSGQQRLTADLRAAAAEVEAGLGLAGAGWGDSRWAAPGAAQEVEPLIRLGELRVRVPPSFGVSAVPALIPFPFTSGLAVGARVADRDRAVGLLRALILRLFASVPPGGLHVRIVDPVAVGQSVADFRHLSEYDSRLMDEKTWTSERDIERVLDELSEHLEVVISTYLRGQFATIDDYNRHAGEVAQPYRALVIFDYPNGFSDRAQRQLLSLVENGPRCGVYTILHYDPAADGREGYGNVPLSRLTHSMGKVTWPGGDVDASLELPATALTAALSAGLSADAGPSLSFDADGRPQTAHAALLAAVGEGVRRVQERPKAVTLDSLLPVLARSKSGALPDYVRGAPPLSVDPATWWTATTAGQAVALLGRSGAQGVTSMYFSSTDVAGGALMVGLPRSGKTTSLHSIICTLSMLYPPDELELYLIDAKHGVEFKAYETLPHTRMVSVHSDREFSLAVLKSIEKEIQRRAELMKAEGSGRANLTEYRQATGAKLARIVVVIDEFHELFEEPDRIGGEAFAAFSNIVRMGPFAGAHVVLASQTLSAMPAMDRPTLLLLPQRVAFMCNDYDAEIVMTPENRAPRFLSKIGEGLFNPARGEESRNQPFQGLYIPTDDRAALVRALASKAAAAGWRRRPRVFDGDSVAGRPPAISAATPPSGRQRGLAVPLGEPFTLDEREGLTLRRTRGANVLLLGDSDDDLSDLAIRGALHSVIAAARAEGAPVTVIDFIGDEDIGRELTVREVAQALGASSARSRGAAAALADLAFDVARRIEAEDYRAPARVLVLFGLQRALSFTPPDPYADDPPGAPSPAAMLAAILKDGPDFGVHTVVSADRLATVSLRLGTDALPEFTLRVLGSGADQQDLAAATGQYGEVPAPRSGQLLLADQTRGTARRVRGYALLTEKTLPTQEAGAFNG
jgi:DNA segregation ATPase FtsK/SpoIIIE, S-DNA-T family